MLVAEVWPTLQSTVLGANQADPALEELRIVGGAATREGRELAAHAVAAGLRARWLDFAGAEAQAAIAAQGSGAVQLPLVIVGGTYTLQRPPFSAVSDCVAALRTGRPPSARFLAADPQCHR